MKIITVSQDDDGQRLDRWLKKAVPEMPYVLAQKLMRKGAIRVGGKRVKPDTRLEAGQDVKIPTFDNDAPKREKQPARFTDEDLTYIRDMIIYEDKDIIALNKPAGLAVQGGTKTKRHIDGLLPLLCNEEGTTPRLVHRLDKDTSGILLLARSAKAARELGFAFQQGRVRKIYWAITSPTPDVLEGTIKAPIVKAGGQYETMVIDEEEGKFAETDYCVIESAGRAAAFMAFWPRTGRTHQIRVHAAQVLGSGVLGDFKYKSAKDEESKLIDADLAGMDIAKRLHLHAHRLIFPHPLNKGKTVDIRAPLTPDLIRSWKALGFDHKYKQDPFAELD